MTPAEKKRALELVDSLGMLADFYRGSQPAPVGTSTAGKPVAEITAELRKLIEDVYNSKPSPRDPLGDTKD